MVELTASGDADQVEARLREALDAHGLQLFARIDIGLAGAGRIVAEAAAENVIERVEVPPQYTSGMTTRLISS